METINHLKKGTLTAVPQDHSQASYAPPLKKEDGLIEWKKSAQEIHNQIRGTLPWPGAFTHLENKLLKIHRSAPCVATPNTLPGTVAEVTPQGIRVATGKGDLLITEVQLQNRRRMTAAEFLKGNPIPVGTRLGSTSGEKENKNKEEQ